MRRTVWLAAALLVASCLATPQAARAETGLVRVASSDFGPSSLMLEFAIGGGGLTGEGRFVATVRGIPAGATITNVTMYVLDRSETYDAQLTVSKTRIEKGKSWGITNVHSNGTTRKVQPFSAPSIDFPVVEEDQIVSMVLFLPQGNSLSLLFMGATVEYSLP